MSVITLRGITWDHRRAVEPLLLTLDSFRCAHPGIDVTWQARTLHGFEFTPIDELARDYDLIVLDHPFAGAIAATNCLLPLDDLAPGLAESFVGPSLQSYVHSGHLWALPIDAACQVAVSRPDLMAAISAEVPSSWNEMLVLGARARSRALYLAISLRGVHSLMTFFTLCANLGKPFADRPTDDDPIDRSTFAEALEFMRRLLDLAPASCLDWNSIELHEAMAERDDLLFCPAVYFYATYAEADRKKPLRFHGLPGPTGHVGSTIGGTGLGISARCRHPDVALAYARHLGLRSTQHIFAQHHGQPAHVACWEDPDIDVRFGGTFAATRRTIEAAWVRPRFLGYLQFQAEGGDLIEAHLRGSITEMALFNAICRSWRSSLSARPAVTVRLPAAKVAPPQR